MDVQTEVAKGDAFWTQQESRARCSELDAAVQAARQALAVEQQSGEGLRATVLELQAEMSRLRVRVADTEGRRGVVSFVPLRELAPVLLTLRRLFP